MHSEGHCGQVESNYLNPGTTSADSQFAHGWQYGGRSGSRRANSGRGVSYRRSFTADSQFPHASQHGRRSGDRGANRGRGQNYPDSSAATCHPGIAVTTERTAFQSNRLRHAQPTESERPSPYIRGPDKDILSTWRHEDFYSLVKAFIDNQTSQELTFPSALTPQQRSTLHRIAMNFKLDHRSSGPPSNRVLTLSKASGAVALQQLQSNALATGQRIKTIDGYQGAQLLPDTFLNLSTATTVMSSLLNLHSQMCQEITVEANKPSHQNKKLRLPQPGLSFVPKNKKDNDGYQRLQQFRLSLPAFVRGPEIVEAVKNNDVIVVSGDTGCGKTTQIPQMLYDAGLFARDHTIVCTQPRRISALSVANRVAAERGEACGNSCGYVIRFENETSTCTRIVYETTGILLRRLHTEPELRDVACVIVDEVHERDVETDFCLLLLRDRLLAQRQDSSRYPTKLKLVVMSATVQVDALVDYFSNCNAGRPVPLITIPGTLFQVDEYFLEDALQWTRTPVSSVPAMTLLSNDTPSSPPVQKDGETTLYEQLKRTIFEDNERDVESMVPYDLLSKLIYHLHEHSPDRSGSILVFLPGWAAIARIAEMLRRSTVARELSVLMLHSSLTSAEQQRVFQPPPKNYRKVVLATSIAETSITIDDIVYVIDTGLLKGTTYDPSGNTSALKATLIGKANGVQRRGRAGRCRRGMCVHLLPRRVYEALPDFLPPEIVRSPLEEVCLQIKAIQPDERCASVLARAMSPPPQKSVNHAVEFLKEAGALTEREEQLTNLGRALAQLPVHPLLGKMLFAAACFGVLDSVATIAAGLSVKSPFIKPRKDQQAAVRESMARLDDHDLSDHLCLLKVYRGWLKSGRSFQYSNANFTDGSQLRSLNRTKQQLMNLVLRSPLVRRLKDPQRDACRHDGNNGLVRLVILWSLYPRIATIEYRANRDTNRAQVFCWDNKPAQFTMSSALANCKRNDFGERSFVLFYERMQLEAQLNLFDSSAMSPVDIALVLRQLTICPLVNAPIALLKDEESKLMPPRYFDVDKLEDKEPYAAMFFDGDKKVYIAEKSVARALQLGRECMDYYLALAIKQLRADVFPETLICDLAQLIGYPVTAVPADTGSTMESVSAGTDGTTVHSPDFLRGYVSGSSDEDEAPVIMDWDGDANATLTLNEHQKANVISAFGDLAIFRVDGAEEFIRAAASAPPLASSTEEREDVLGDEDEEDVVVAAAGDLNF